MRIEASLARNWVSVVGDVHLEGGKWYRANLRYDRHGHRHQMEIEVQVDPVSRRDSGKIFVGCEKLHTEYDLFDWRELGGK